MTLKSIELIGFKSFGKKSLLTFTTPVTAIVGPNGSGKSNIVEAMRFVLGEQSMKSLRSRGGSDLIFKGSKRLAKANRAIVLITFDNRDKTFSFTNSGLGVSLDYDDVIISREVFADGTNRYSINGTEVRLKDVVDLLASVNIGSSGHHIISQGKADRVLNASNRDRKAMIEDALGLRVYQYRIKEAEKKLEKTVNNMKEVQSLRREIAPHLKFLKKQAVAIEKAKELRGELKELYKTYISNESTYIKKETERLSTLRHNLEEKGSILDQQINELETKRNGNNIESKYTQKLREGESKLSEIRRGKDELSRSLGRIDGIKESLKRQLDTSRVPEEEKFISTKELSGAIEDIKRKINEALESKELPRIIEILNNIKAKLSNIYKKAETDKPTSNIHLEAEFKEMQAEKESITLKLKSISEEENNILGAIKDIREKEKSEQESLREGERALYEKLNEKNSVVSSLNSLKFKQENLNLVKNAFNEELKEAGVLIGREIINYMETVIDSEVDRQNQDNLKRKIERIKIKLEDSESTNAPEIMKEFGETEERDAFLAKELDDLKNSMDSLNSVIEELKGTLDKEFKEGIDKINKQFQEFFSTMFGGGKASLTLTMEYKKSRKRDDLSQLEAELEVNSEDEANELGFDRGIEIDVSLPRKKVKDLNMLSGGERSLTSIALLFAISQVNPPPFMVLDETDAALDEANSRKYGDMLESLSKYSELIIVTHNRETMSRASVLYGVTMGAGEVSQLLSIHLEDAAAYAK